jgi:putative hemolysin
MDLLFILLLMLLNGVFAMSEIAVVSARRSRLQSLADAGRRGARTAIALQESPGGFLSTVQVGITLVAILSGAFGEAALAGPLAEWLSRFPALAPYAAGLALALVVAGITYFSVVVGELVPKQLALLAPEAVASQVARPFGWLSRAALPLVWALSASSALVLRLLGAHRQAEPPGSDEEIKVLMTQGAEAGVFHASERAIVANVLRLDEQPIGAIMTPRNEIHHLDLADSFEAVQRDLAQSTHTLLPVCRDGLDERLLGVLKVVDLLPRLLAGRRLTAEDIETALHPPLFVPESLTTTQLLDSFRARRVNLALIVDEYGSLQGLVTLSDVLASIVGGPVGEEPEQERDIVQREDGSWLVDGAVTLERLRAELGREGQSLPGEEERTFHTIGGFVMHTLGRIPLAADRFEAEGLRFEVMDMDRQRVDKVLVSIPPELNSNSEVRGREAET